MFDIAPKAPYVVKAVEDFRAESAAGHRINHLRQMAHVRVFFTSIRLT